MVIDMKKKKIDIVLLILLIIFSFISIITIFSAQNILPDYLKHIYIKQILWYILGFLTISVIIKIKINWIYDNIFWFYVLGNILLVLLLFFGESVNGAKCWFKIYGLGSFQPSEFMKIILIIYIAKMIDKFHKDFDNPTFFDEFKFLIKAFIILAIPSFLTFLEPDTGNVIIYFLILFIMLFIGGIRYQWFLIFFILVLAILGSIIYLYYFNIDLFKTILGDDFFLRINRILDWSKKDGYQLNKSLISIGSAGILGYGINNTPLYFPEAQTDFIFGVFASTFGYIGSFILLFLIAIFDIKIINIAKNIKSKINKYFISGVLGMLLFQQFQNIAMTFGLMPITGITLPFISYGGSSLVLFMIMIGLILNITRNDYN